MIWLIGILAVYLLAMFAIAWFSLHPFRIPIFLSPGAMAVPQEDVEFASGDLKIRGWWSPVEGSDRVMILCHGYMMNRSELAPIAVELWKRGVSCLLIDFRAHGRSQGKKSFLGYREAEDVIAAVGWVRSLVPGAKVGLLGSSMGSAASAIAAGERPGLVDVLVLDSAYSRLPSAVLGWWRFLGGPVLSAALSPTVLLAAPLAGFNPFSIDVARCLTKAGDVPVLLLHGDSDNLALPAEAERNHAAVGGPKELVWLPGSGHSEGRWLHPERYYGALFGFLRQIGFMDG